MLRFATKPDTVFPVFLHDAIEGTLDEIELDPSPEEQQEAFEALMPSSAKVFGFQEAKQQLRALHTALAETALYKPTDYHWLLLYELLELYSEGFNNMPHGRVCEAFGIQHIDFDLLVELFFWDNDFLDVDIPDMPLEARQHMGISPETFGLTAGMKPHPEELVLKICDVEMVKEFEAQGCVVFLPGSATYPSCSDVQTN